MKKLSVFLLATWVASNAFAAEVDDSDKARITGVVVDAWGKPVPGAEVRVVDAKLKPVRAGADGRFAVLLEGYSVLGERLVASDAGGAHMGMWEAESDARINQHTQFFEARVVIRPSVAIQVRVEDALHAPVSGAQVAAMHGHQVTVTTWTDDKGAATLRIPDNTGLRHMFAMKPGTGFDYVENSDGSQHWPPPPPPASATFTLDGVRPVTVKAVGSDGKPVAGVEFFPSHLQKEGKARYIEIFMSSDAVGLSRTTNGNGVATFDFLPSSMTQSNYFHISTEGAFRTEKNPYWVFHEGNADAVAEFTSRVMPKSSLKGKVSLPDGSPAPGIIVSAQGYGYGSNGGVERALTRKDGTFVMRVGPEGSYMVGVHEPDWAARSLTGVVVKEGQDRDGLQLQLLKGTLIRGTVLDAPGGKPLPGHMVCVMEQGANIDFTKLAGSEKPRWHRESRYTGTETDDAGKYSIRVGPGSYRIGTNYVEQEGTAAKVVDQEEMIVDVVKGSE